MNEKTPKPAINTNDDAAFQGPACPLPFQEYAKIQLAHGGGGKLSNRLIEEHILPAFRNDLLARLHDGAVTTIGGVRVAFSTDSYVVHPLVFPGGDIGELAVNGTVNDLAMCGAIPQYLSVALIIEEGFPMDELSAILASMRKAADAAGVLLVTGDTKVVDRGKADKLFVTTSGIGIVPEGIDIAPGRAAVGDVVIISGPIGLHGMAILSVREGLQFESPIVSDTAPLNGLVKAMFDASAEIHVLRDPTRGGVASALNEIARSAAVGIVLDERSLPVPEEVCGACEILGLDPLYVANEGKLVALVNPAHATRILHAMRAHRYGREAQIIGTVVQDHPGTVMMKTAIGGMRIVDMLSGEQLPRIC